MFWELPVISSLNRRMMWRSWAANDMRGGILVWPQGGNRLICVHALNTLKVNDISEAFSELKMANSKLKSYRIFLHTCPKLCIKSVAIQIIFFCLVFVVKLLFWVHKVWKKTVFISLFFTYWPLLSVRPSYFIILLYFPYNYLSC